MPVSAPAEDCRTSMPVSVPAGDHRTSMPVSTPAAAAPGQQVRQDVRRPPVSCQPVSDFVTFGLIQAASCRKSKKIGLKAARTENKKPLEIFLSLKNVMKTKKKKPPRKTAKRKAGLSAAVNKKALPKSSATIPLRREKTSIPCTKKSFLKNFQKGIDFYYTMVYNKDSR